MVESISERNMFSSTLDSSWSERSHRGWTALTSFGLQAFVTGVLLLLPLLRPMGLPSFHQLSTPISLGKPTEGPTVRAHAGASHAPTNAIQIIFRPRTEPEIGRPTPADEGPPIADSGPYIPGPRSGDTRGIRNLFEGGTQPVLPAPAPPAPVAHMLRFSHISEGNLIRKVQPAYPPLARSARIQGTVVLQAVISKQGTIENLSVLSGHPMLVQAALDAVRQWRYRPYILNSEPVEVETQITVNFSLAEN
jgi:protein TonB